VNLRGSFGELPDLSVEPSGFRYLPNKLHGDEIVDADGRVFADVSEEWLTADEVSAVLRADPATVMVLVDHNASMPVVRRLRAGAWERLGRRYVTDDGLPGEGTDLYLRAGIWADAEGRRLLVFALEC
jgi:hypothetical protein